MFDWETYDARPIPDQVFTTKDYFLSEYAYLHITDEEYETFMNGVVFDW